MSLKEKLTSILFGQKPENPPEEGEQRPGPAQLEAESPESSPFPAQDPSIIKLPGEHPMLQLYGMRRREVGHLPTPWLCMDEDGNLPPELIRKEKSRLEGALKNVSNFRIRATKNGQKQRKKGKKDSEEEVREEPMPQGLDAMPWFFISSDKLYAWVLVFPPTENGRELTRDILLRTMEEQGIAYGVDQRLVDRLSHDEHRYFSLFLIAQGKPAFDGKNGNIVDNFPRVVERVLVVDEYDQVDYTALNLIHNVKEGQEICRLIRPTEGEPGRTVLDQEIPEIGRAHV